MNNELTELDNEQIANLITQGYTNGILDGEDYRISWELTTNKFDD